MKKIIIHVGPHKTGSTYIQKKLHMNRSVLEEHGICYPEIFYRHFGQHELISRLNNSDNADVIANALRTKTSGFDTVLLSSERYYNINKEGWKKLKASLPDVEFQFIFYIRKPSMRMLSLWQETVKQGSTQSVGDFFLHQALKPMQNRNINYLYFIDELNEVFGKNSIKLIDYQTAKSQKKMLKTFFNASEIDVKIHDTQETVNEMMPLSEIELLRYLNFRTTYEKVISPAALRKLYFDKKNDIIDTIARFNELLEKDSEEIVLGNTGYDGLLLQGIEKRYPDNMVNPLSDLEAKSYRIPDQNWILNPEKIQIADQVYRFITAD